MNFYRITAIGLVLFVSGVCRASENVIEKQLQEIGSIPNEEVVVVQRKYTRKVMRSELTPFSFGGVPFGTVRTTMFGGASYTLHLNDWFAIEPVEFLYSKNFFTGFTSDINAHKGSGANPGAPDIKPDVQQLIYVLSGGIQITPFYGKMSSFSRWIAYVEPFLSLNVGYAKTETDGYFTYAPGIGMRFFFREWFSMKVEFKDYLYTENYINRQSGASATELTNNYAVMLSFSFWLPKMPR